MRALSFLVLALLLSGCAETIHGNFQNDAKYLAYNLTYSTKTDPTIITACTNVAPSHACDFMLKPGEYFLTAIPSVPPETLIAKHGLGQARLHFYTQSHDYKFRLWDEKTDHVEIQGVDDMNAAMVGLPHLDVVK